MRAARIRLLLAAGLFLAWIGWLAYLAATTTHPVVLSRPQFLVANLHVIADLKGGAEHPDAEVTVRQAGGPGADPQREKPGSRLTVADLPRIGPGQGWDGPGEYILALTRRPDGTYMVTPLPPSPGYPPESPHVPANRLRIYKATPPAREQLQAIQGQ